MSRIQGVFAGLRARGRTALVPFVTAGDPRREVTVPLMHAMVGGGADIHELGVPFSDPMADGPVIQRASERALAQGVSLGVCLDMVRDFRERDTSTPVVLMGYLNPIEAMGYPAFADRAAAAGVDGVLVVDAPPEEAEDLLAALRARAIDPIYLLAPTSTEGRIRRICEAASGFVYYVSIKGVTGAAPPDVVEVGRRLEGIRRVTRLPLGVGFGIKDPETAARMAAVADAVVVGSAVVGRMEALEARPEAIPGEVAGFLRGLREALDAVRKI
jgi:tryptophan synthase alpha chain